MFILASASPRRRELLQQIGASFDVKVSNAEEIGNNELSADELVKWNALAKAKAVTAENPNIPVLGADTVVALNGEIFGKPGNDDNARKMLRRLAGRTHQVWTGIAWVSRGETYTDVVCTDVNMEPIGETAIDNYVATGEPLDKAGAYAIQGRAAVFIDSIEGSYSNVVGLPLAAVAKLAREAGVDIYGHSGS